MNIKARAPARIDLAGGTLDLWPIYLFFENTATINCAINQFAEVEIKTASESRVGDTPFIHINSQDRGVSHTFRSFGELLEAFENTHKAVQLPSALWLHTRVLRHFLSFWRRSASLEVNTSCASPAGAGLGGSSALNIALCSALRKLTLANFSDSQLIDLARDLETTVIDVPAGIQDLWSALFGGVQAIRMEAGRVHRKVFPHSAEFIENHIVLCYTGTSRNSGINNWSVYKKFIDGDDSVRAAFKEIVQATYRMEEALEKKSFDKLIHSLNQEWNSRQKLASGIATPEMLQIIDYAKEHGSEAAKVCGAGGGGCFILAVDAERKSSLVSALRKNKTQVIDFKIVQDGCVLEEF